jgi:hypothetical protein
MDENAFKVSLGRDPEQKQIDPFLSRHRQRTPFIVVSSPLAAAVAAAVAVAATTPAANATAAFDG